MSGFTKMKEWREISSSNTSQSHYLVRNRSKVSGLTFIHGHTIDLGKTKEYSVIPGTLCGEPLGNLNNSVGLMCLVQGPMPKYRYIVSTRLVGGRK